ncbi:MAG: hypothetical protein OHK0023_20450 [Anaerolineae bacterium]
MELTVTTLLAGAFCAIYIALLVASLRVQPVSTRARRWLRGTLGFALAAQLVHLLPTNAHLGNLSGLFFGGLTQPSAAVLATTLVLIAFSALSVRFLARGLAFLLLGLGGISTAVVSLNVINLTEKVMLGRSGWIPDSFGTPNDPYGLAIILIWVVFAVLGFAATLYSFSTAHLPELANRAMFWLLVSPLVWMGGILSVSGANFLRETGFVLQAIGMAGATYAVIRLRVLDVRRLFRTIFDTFLLFAMALIVVFGALNVAESIALGEGESARTVVLLGIAIGSALVIVPLRAAGNIFLDRIFGSPQEDSTSNMRQYAQDIAGVVELNELADFAIAAERKMLRVRRGGLILATNENEETVRVEPMSSTLSDMPTDIRGWIPRATSLYRTLFESRRAVLQYDLEYSREYNDVPLELKSFFKQLKMAAYAPIVVQTEVIGILAASAKPNDDPFSPQDLDLLVTMASQTGVALRNARLVNDLRRVRDETQALNTDILGTQQRLEMLDAVKTDFVTIASHELRTPLTQILGYADILEMMSNSPTVQGDRVGVMTFKIREAIKRVDQLIGDMLDVSQIGLDAMDLRFAETTVEAVVLTPLRELNEDLQQQRKLHVSARGLKGLPPIQADYKRLVQAFQNIILNAIKYTPDGGRIDINAKLETDPKSDKEQIHITIADSGIGIDPKNLELIFEKFFRVGDPGLHSTGRMKFMGAGPGLGLTIARGVINSHGGRMWAESTGMDIEKCPGTTIHVVLPVKQQEAKDGTLSRIEVMLSGTNTQQRRAALGVAALKPPTGQVATPTAQKQTEQAH